MNAIGFIVLTVLLTILSILLVILPGVRARKKLEEYEFNNRTSGGVVQFKTFHDSELHARAKNWALTRERLGGVIIGLCFMGFLGAIAWIFILWLAMPFSNVHTNRSHAAASTVAKPKEIHRNKTLPKSANGYGGAVIQPSEETSRPHYLPQFAFLIGEWECLTPGNHYRMRVDWDSPNKQFRGYLSKQGQTSENVGFRLGELVWIAQPSGEHTFIERQEWRNGANGTSSSYQWRNGNFSVERSSQDHLVSSQEFMRVR
jgi:hypothetical protein